MKSLYVASTKEGSSTYFGLSQKGIDRAPTFLRLAPPPACACTTAHSLPLSCPPALTFFHLFPPPSLPCPLWQVSALDFDGQRAVSAGMDGTVNVYTLAGSGSGSGTGSGSGSGEEGVERRRRGQPRAFAKAALKFSDAAVLAQQQEEEQQGGSRGGESPPGATATAPRPTAQAGQQQQQLVFESLHTKRVTGARLLPSAPNAVVGGGAAAPAPLMVTCGLDKVRVPRCSVFYVVFLPVVCVSCIPCRPLLASRSVPLLTTYPSICCIGSVCGAWTWPRGRCSTR